MKGRFTKCKRALCCLLAAAALAAFPHTALAAEDGFGHPESVALVIGGSQITRGKDFLKSTLWLTQDELDAVADAASGEATYRLGLGDSYSEIQTYSAYENHGEPTWVYRRVSGLDLTLLAQALGVDTDQKLSVTVSSGDGASKTLSDAFSFETNRAAYAPDGSVLSAVGPILALYATASETLEQGAGVLPQAPQLGAGSADRVKPLFGFGQTTADEVTNCYWIKDVCRLRFGSEEAALTLTDAGGKTVSASLSTLISGGVWNVELGSVRAAGAPLAALLEVMGVTVSSDRALQAVDSRGETMEIDDPSQVFVAWYATESGAGVANQTALRLYTRDGGCLPDLVSLSVVARPEQAQTTGFLDLDGYGWARDAIEALSAQGVVNGDGNGGFLPNAKITRGDFMLMLYRAYDLQAVGGESFPDVPADSYYAQAIAAGKALGIAQGSGGSFRPTGSISRQEAMTLLYRALQAAGKDLDGSAGALDAFADGDAVADWAVEGVSALVHAGVIQGSEGRIDPDGTMTRAEMAVALWRALNL